MMEWIYWTISWILLLWHTVWDKLIPGSGRFLATNWDWILAIVFLVITVRVILFPVFVKQIRSQRAMQALQPKMKALQEKHKGDRETLQKELMELYRAEKVNPLMGCLPMFLQIPVFLGLFHVLKRLNPENSGKARYGWTETEFIRAAGARLFNAPITAKFSSSSSDLAALHANATTVKIVAGFLVIIMMVTTYMTSRQMILKTGWSEDPQQRMIQKLMLYGIPVSLLLSGWAFPIGVIIYWVTTNLFSYGQQYWVLHKYPPPALAPGAKVTATAPVRASAIAAPGRRSDAKTGGRPAGSGAGSAVSGVGRAGAAAARRLGILGKNRTDAPDRADTTTNNGGKPAASGQALAPRPGAKPVNPKKGGAKRRSG